MAEQPDAGAAAVDAYLDSVSEPQQSTLRALRATLRTVLPTAQERISYNMPTFAVNGKSVVSYAGFKNHCSYFPHSGNVFVVVGSAVAKYPVNNGTLQFPVDKPLPIGLVRKLVRARLNEISDVRNGKRVDYYDDGAVKASGSVKDGQLHGAWTWYRRDGSLMRAGRFNRGEPTGTWETWTADGALHKTTEF